MTEKRKLPLKAIAAGVAAAAIGGVVFARLVLFTPLVSVVEVKEGVVEEQVKGLGAVSSRTEVDVSSRISGVVLRVLAQEGDRVKEGQLLAALDERDLAAKAAAARSAVAAARQNIAVAEATLDKSQADLVFARSNHERDEKVFRAGHISQAAFDAATAALRVAESAEKSARAAVAARQQETARAEDDARYAGTIQTHARISSPIAGLVTMRRVEVGNTVAPGNTLFRVVDDKAVSVAARIDVSQVGRIALGQITRIRLASGGEASGTVARISHESDPVTRDQEVRILFDTPPAHLTVNEEAEVVISVGQARGLVIPGSAVLPLPDGGDGVLVVRDGRAQHVAVEVGALGQGKVQIRSGLRAGEMVVGHPRAVKPGQRVRPKVGD
jgi:HlyD family secretion protein